MPSLTTCPACHYTRQLTDDAPDWECPKCQKAYIKSARKEHQSESIEKEHPSKKSILIPILGEERLEPGSQMNFDASQFGDPVAMQTKWKPANHYKTVGTTGELKRELVEVSSDRLEFSENKITRKWGFIFTLVGIIGFVATLHTNKPLPLYKEILLHGGFLFFTAFGAYMLIFFNKPAVFDKIRGYYWKGRKGPDLSSVKDFALLVDIHAIQLIYWKNPVTSDYNSHNIELNLVLKDSRRVNVAIYSGDYYLLSSSKNRLGSIEKESRKHAAILARFIGKPVWDAIDSTKNYYISKGARSLDVLTG